MVGAITGIMRQADKNGVKKMKKKYVIEIKANWNDCVLASWEYPEILVSGIEDVCKFVREQINKCSDFNDCHCRVRVIEG